MDFQIKVQKEVKKPVPQKSHKIFQDAMDEDNEPKPQKTSAKAMPFLIAELAKASEQKTLKEATKHILEDPDIYEYDSLHDNIAQARQVVAEQKKMKAPSRYISQISQTTEKRKVEQSIAYENMAEKELKRENKQFSDTGRYITSSYLKMKEAGKNFQLEDQKREEYNKQHSIDQGSNVGLYKDMFNNDMFAGGHRPDITKIMQAQKDGISNKTQSSASEASNKAPENHPEQQENIQFDLSSVSRREEETKAEIMKKEYQRERSRTRSKSPKDTRTEKPINEPIEPKRDIKKEESKEPVAVEESKIDKPLSKEEKLRLAKEKLLKRKTEQPNA